MNEEVYINFSKCSEVNSEKITIQDVAEIWCSDTALMSGIKSMAIARLKGDRDVVKVFTAVSVIKMLQTRFPEITVQCIGVPEFMVIFHKEKKVSIIWQLMKIVIISIIVFFGVAFAIIAYGNDIDIQNIFYVITDFCTGDAESNAMILQIAYSVGLSVGIIIFFNNFGKRKSVKDPTPIQVSMRNYEEDIYTTIIDDNIREGKTGDVD